MVPHVASGSHACSLRSAQHRPRNTGITWSLAVKTISVKLRQQLSHWVVSATQASWCNCPHESHSGREKVYHPFGFKIKSEIPSLKGPSSAISSGGSSKSRLSSPRWGACCKYVEQFGSQKLLHHQRALFAALYHLSSVWERHSPLWSDKLCDSDYYVWWYQCNLSWFLIPLWGWFFYPHPMKCLIVNYLDRNTDTSAIWLVVENPTMKFIAIHFECRKIRAVVVFTKLVA